MTRCRNNFEDCEVLSPLSSRPVAESEMQDSTYWSPIKRQTKHCYAERICFTHILSGREWGRLPSVCEVNISQIALIFPMPSPLKFGRRSYRRKKRACSIQYQTFLPVLSVILPPRSIWCVFPSYWRRWICWYCSRCGRRRGRWDLCNHKRSQPFITGIMHLNFSSWYKFKFLVPTVKSDGPVRSTEGVFC